MADATELLIGQKGGRLLLTVHAKPRAKKSAIRGFREGGVELAVAAPPVDGAANEEIVRALSGWLSVPKRDIEIVRGTSGREKIVAVTGISEQALRAALAAAVVERAP